MTAPENVSFFHLIPRRNFVDVRNGSSRDSSGSPQPGGAGEAYADGATRERPVALAEHTAGRGL